MRAPVASLAVLLAVLAVIGGGSDVGAGAAPVDAPVDRVLVVSLPGVSWSDARAGDLPVLDEFVRDAAVGDLATRIGRQRASTTDAYLTIGAGTRALAPFVDVAVALDPDESYGGIPSGEIIERRLGTVPTGITYMATGAAIDRNDGLAYGAEIGLLGDALEAGGVARAVIANADAAEGFVSEEPPPDGAYTRGSGHRPHGQRRRRAGRHRRAGPARRRPRRPLRPTARRGPGARCLRRAWARRPARGPGRGVRPEPRRGLRTRSTEAQEAALDAQALEDADALLGVLLERVDPDHDAVLVLAPVAPAAAPDLSIVALRAPGLEPGVLRSATTRRDGYVQLADVAPTILDLLGEEVPGGIEGRPFGVQPRPGEDRVEGLVEAADAAAFRDDVLPAVVTLVIVGLLALCVATWQRHRLPRGVRTALGPLALVALGVVPASFLVGRLQSTVGAPAAYAVGLLLLAAGFGLVAAVADRRWRECGLVVALGGIVALFLVDVSLGAPLQLNTVFGYSVAVAGRFAGVGNLAFALFGSAAILLAAVVADRYGASGVRAAIALLAVVVVVEGLPMLGADVGGVLAMVPAFGVTALILSGRRARPVHLLVLAGLGAVLVVGLAAVDLARPEASRTHLGRLAADVLDGRWDALGDTIARRWQASFGGAELVTWLLVFGVLAAAVTYAVLVAVGWLGPEAPRRRATDRRWRRWPVWRCSPPWASSPTTPRSRYPPPC